MDSNDRLIKAVSLKNESKNKWYNSDTAKAPSVRYAHQNKIKFEYGPMLLAAVASEDIDETTRLIKEGADVNYANAEGLTPLHQACIDENFEMVKLLVDKGANINACDNEGWTSLHAAANREIPIEIIKYLVNRGANIVAVNADGQLPVDLSENDQIIKYFDDEIERRGIDIDEAREVEEKIMRIDAEKWQKNGKIDDVRDSQGATPLHVAASKGYAEIAHILLKCGADPNACDQDDWTPLHAAVYWKNKEIITDLVAHGAKIYAPNKNNQSPLSLSEKEIKPLLISLATQYNQKAGDEQPKKVTPKKNLKVNGILKAPKSDDDVVKIPRPISKPPVLDKSEKLEPEKSQSTNISTPSKTEIPKPTISKPTPTITSLPSSIQKPATPVQRPTIANPPSTTQISTQPTKSVNLPPTRITKPPDTSDQGISKPSKPADSTPIKESLEMKELKEKVSSLECEVNTLKKERDNLLKIIDNLRAESQKNKPSPISPQTSSIARPPGRR